MSIGWGSGLAPKRQQAIIWTNADPVLLTHICGTRGRWDNWDKSLIGCWRCYFTACISLYSNTCDENSVKMMTFPLQYMGQNWAGMRWRRSVSVLACLYGWVETTLWKQMTWALSHFIDVSVIFLGCPQGWSGLPSADASLGSISICVGWDFAAHNIFWLTV